MASWASTTTTPPARQVSTLSLACSGLFCRSFQPFCPVSFSSVLTHMLPHSLSSSLRASSHVLLTTLQANALLKARHATTANFFEQTKTARYRQQVHSKIQGHQNGSGGTLPRCPLRRRDGRQNHILPPFGGGGCGTDFCSPLLQRD